MIGWQQGSNLEDASVALPAGWVGHGFVGRRLNVPTATTANVWGGPTLIRPLPLAPLAMSIKSSAAGDNFATAAGAQFAVVSFVDENGDWRWSDLLALTGVTPVPITYKPASQLYTASPPFVPTPPDGSSIPASVFRVQSVAVVLAAGSTQAAPFASNVGNLDVVDTATGLVVFDRVPIGRGVSQSAAMHIPRNFRGLLTRWVVGTERGAAKLSFDAQLAGSNSWARVTFSSVDSATSIYVPDAPVVPIPARSDFVATVETSTNNIDIVTNNQVRLEPQP